MTQPTSIEAQRVEHRENAAFLVRKIGSRHVLRFETHTPFLFGVFTRVLDAGTWDCYELSNGGFYIAPWLPDKTIAVRVDALAFAHALSPDAAGVVATYHAIDAMIAKTPDPYLDELLRLLREFAVGFHPEAAVLAKALPSLR